MPDSNRSRDVAAALTAEALAPKILSGDRRALARAITLVESGRSDHRAQAIDLIALLKPQTQRPALRIGLSGTPGVGKSTLIERVHETQRAQGSVPAVNQNWHQLPIFLSNSRALQCFLG